MNNLNLWALKKREHPENHGDRLSETESKRPKSFSAAITAGWGKPQVAPRAILSVDNSDDDSGEELDSGEERSEEDEAPDLSDQEFLVSDTESSEDEEDEEEEEEEDEEELEHPEEQREDAVAPSSNGRRRAFQLKSAQTDTSLANMIAHIYASLLFDSVGCRLEADTMGEQSAMNRARQELNGSWPGSSSTNDTVVSFKRFLILRGQILEVVDEPLVSNDTTDPSMAYHLCSHLKEMIQTKVKPQWGIGEEADPQERVQYYRKNFEKSMTESLASVEDQLWSFLHKEGVLQSRNLQ